jgi:hypothetical protein
MPKASVAHSGRAFKPRAPAFALPEEASEVTSAVAPAEPAASSKTRARAVAAAVTASPGSWLWA